MRKSRAVKRGRAEQRTSTDQFARIFGHFHCQPEHSLSWWRPFDSCYAHQRASCVQACEPSERRQTAGGIVSVLVLAKRPDCGSAIRLCGLGDHLQQLYCADAPMRGRRPEVYAATGQQASIADTGPSEKRGPCVASCEWICPGDWSGCGPVHWTSNICGIRVSN